MDEVPEYEVESILFSRYAVFMLAGGHAGVFLSFYSELSIINNNIRY